MRGLLVVACAVLVVLAAAAPASAQAPVNVPWERLLPGLPVGGHQPRAIDGCSDGSPACIDRVEQRLQAQFEALDAACDHRVIAALAYLRITQALRADLSRAKPRFFRDRRWMAFVITDFANQYFASFERYVAGLPVPAAWRRFYDAAMKEDTNAAQDLLLFSNAHAQHDLPLTYARMGLRTPDGRSRKPDHDGVNEINVRVIPGVAAEVAARYDPTFPQAPGPVDEMAGLEPTKTWREGAWRSAERLVTAPPGAPRDAVRAHIERSSAAWAHLIAAPQQAGTRAARDAFCRRARSAAASARP